MALLVNSVMAGPLKRLEDEIATESMGINLFKHKSYVIF